mmetsp:Transcript_15354/g.17205  ORF Transcript_15354/g.17205 Transcript_15354/m.17205 type:complete len:85 (-) Transcript_15354:87-341(-)
MTGEDEILYTGGNDEEVEELTIELCAARLVKIVVNGCMHHLRWVDCIGAVDEISALQQSLLWLNRQTSTVSAHHRLLCSVQLRF